MDTKNEDETTFNNAIHYFRKIIYSNIKTASKHYVNATFIGIKTNISGKNKLHIYILLFPFGRKENFTPYDDYTPQNIYIKDVSFGVDITFYRWMYTEIKQNNNIVMLELSLSEYSFTAVHSDALIRKTRFSEKGGKFENSEIITTEEFEEWYETATFKHPFLIEITNPYLYMVPFPVKSLYFKTESHSNTLLNFQKNHNCEM